jgi:hypothetical protein
MSELQIELRSLIRHLMPNKYLLIPLLEKLPEKASKFSNKNGEKTQFDLLLWTI